MARHPRVIVPEVAVHLVQRGNDRQICFRQEVDYLVYLGNLRELSRKHACAVHAYCLMTNHVHLLLTPSGEGSCAHLMRDLGRRYVRYFNDRYDRTGTLWEGRFRSCLVDSAEYVLACHRYIELNPVRAGMVQSPHDYAWSSHRANRGLTMDGWLTPHAEFLALGSMESVRYGSYHALFDGEDAPAFLKTVREATAGGFPLVGDALKATLAGNGLRLAPAKPGPRGIATLDRN